MMKKSEVKKAKAEKVELKVYDGMTQLRKEIEVNEELNAEHIKSELKKYGEYEREKVVVYFYNLMISHYNKVVIACAKKKIPYMVGCEYLAVLKRYFTSLFSKSAEFFISEKTYIEYLDELNKFYLKYSSLIIDMLESEERD